MVQVIVFEGSIPSAVRKENYRKLKRNKKQQAIHQFAVAKCLFKSDKRV
jgi:fructose-1-phosphate kinase PfkB-like protein